MQSLRDAFWHHQYLRACRDYQAAESCFQWATGTGWVDRAIAQMARAEEEITVALEQLHEPPRTLNESSLKEI